MYVSAINNFHTYNINLYTRKREPAFGDNYLLYDEINDLIKNGDISAVRNLPDLHIINKNNENLLHSASRNESVDIAKYLLYKKVNPNLKNKYGKTPFSVACSKNNKELVEAFLPYDIDINTQDKLGETPLHKAIEFPEIVELLLENGANPYIKDSFEKSPYELSFVSDSLLLKFLRFGVNPNTEIKNKQTLMHKSISENRLETAKLLKQYNADLNYKDKDGKSPIFYTNNLKSLDWLLDNGANINLTDNNKRTLLHEKTIVNDTKYIVHLVKRGADVNINDNRNLPPLAYASKTATMNFLLDNGANPDIIAPNGLTILSNCVKSNNLKAVYLLTSHNANPNIKDKNNNVSLDYAKNNDLRALLLASGANPNYKNYLIDALKSKDFEYFGYLLESGANPDKTDAKGNSAVFYLHNEKELNELIKYKANLNLYNNYGYAPIHHYALLGKKSMVNLLRKNGVCDIKSLNGESVDDCYKKYQTYHSWLKHSDKIPAFTGNRDYTVYGTPKLRAELNYKPKLTKEKINEIIENASTTDEGLVQAYKELKTEEKQIYLAMSALTPVIEHFNIMIKDDISRIVNSNPSGSKIPIVGIFKQYNDTVFTDNFRSKNEAQLKELSDEYADIVRNYYSGNITNMVNNYEELNTYLTQGVEYVNYVKGSNKTRNKILNNLEKSKQACRLKYIKKGKSLDKAAKKYEAAFNKILDIQDDKQTNRTVRKTVIKFITLGMG